MLFVILPAAAETRSLSGGVEYEPIGTYDVERLNTILTTEYAEFSDFPVSYPPAGTGVELYRVSYPTVVPELNNRPVRATGLVAIPQSPSPEAPLLSYQHGTVFSKDGVPSFPEKSMETRLMLACFAGQGYVMIAPDYIGKGGSPEPDSYVVKESTAQACSDMLAAARALLAEKGVQTKGLYLCGWSQGTFSTEAFLHRLESNGESVTAAAFASAPNDLYLCLNRWIHVSSPFDVQWLIGAVTLIIHSYEHYHRLPGLSEVAIRPEYLQTARDLYENRISWEDAAEAFPQTVREFLQDEFVNEGSMAGNRFFQLLQENEAYNWRFRTPTRFYYGQIDEVVSPYAATLPVNYQKAIGGASCEEVFAGEQANHRGTFAYATRHLQDWFGAFSGIRPPDPGGE